MRRRRLVALNPRLSASLRLDRNRGRPLTGSDLDTRPDTKTKCTRSAKPTAYRDEWRCRWSMAL